MHPWTRELLAHLDASRAQLLGAVESLSEARRGLAPSAGRWSIANVLSHLARTEGQIGALLERKFRAAIAAGGVAELGADLAPIVASFDSALVLDRRQQIRAPDFASPDLSMTAAEALSALTRARQRLGDVVLAADGKDLRHARQPHFLLGDLDFYQWVAFAGFHELRHVGQAREISAALSGSD